MRVLITHTDPAVSVSLPHRMQDLDQLIAKRYQEAITLEEQIIDIRRRQDELDHEIEEAFSLRNDIARGLGRDDVYEDFLSLLKSCGQHSC